MAMGKRLKGVRTKKKLLQREVAERVGISNVTLSQYENDIRKPDPDRLAKLADVLEVSSDYLLGLTDNPTPKTDDHNPYFGLSLDGLSPQGRDMVMTFIEIIRHKEPTLKQLKEIERFIEFSFHKNDEEKG